MKAILFNTFIILLFISPFISHAQGIKGRRVVINYNLQLSGAFDAPTYQSKYDDLPEYLRITTNHQAELDFILTKSWMIGPDFHFFKARTEDRSEEGALFIQDRGIGFHIKNFSYLRGEIAPIGVWTKLRVYYSRGVGTRVKDNSYAGTFNIWNMSLSVGKQIPITKYILFTSGVGMDFGNLHAKFEEGTYITESGLESQVIDSLTFHQILFINLGFGWNVGF